MNPLQIKNQIESHLDGVVADVTGEDGVHFQAIVTGPIFEGKSRVASQQLVYGAINHWIQSGQIHAISIKTKVA